MSDCRQELLTAGDDDRGEERRSEATGSPGLEHIADILRRVIVEQGWDRLPKAVPEAPMTTRRPVQARGVTAAHNHLDEPIPIAPTELARILAAACEWTMTNSGEVYDETGGLLAGSIEEIANLAIKAGMFSRNAKGFSGIRWREEVGGLGASSRFSTADALRSVRERPAGRRRGVGR